MAPSSSSSYQPVKAFPSTLNEVKRRFVELAEGQKNVVNCSERLPVEKPPWYDEKKFQQGQSFFRKYRFGILLSNLCCLVLVMVWPDAVKPLIFSRKSETRWKAFKRYLATVIHISSWYLGNIWEDENAARKSIQRVRSYHSKAAIRMNQPEIRPLVDKTNIGNCVPRLDLDKPVRHVLNKDLKHLDDCPYAELMASSTCPRVTHTFPVINQFEMSMTQFAFMGLALLYPRKFGFSSATKEDLDGLIHFWRCIGYMLGIEDRFNFCDDDNFDSVRALADFTVHKMMKPNLKKMSAESEHMMKAVTGGLQFYLPGFSTRSVLMYIFWVLDLNVPRFLSTMDRRSWIHCRLLKCVCCDLSWIPGLKAILNNVLRVILWSIVCPPTWWPESLRPPNVKGLAEYWVE